MPGPRNALSNPLAYIKEVSAINQQQEEAMRQREQQRRQMEINQRVAEYQQRQMQMEAARRKKIPTAPMALPMTDEAREAERIATLMMQMKQGRAVPLEQFPEQYVHVQKPRNALSGM